MMFLQYAVWGAWMPVLSATLVGRLNATGDQIGNVYLMIWAACIITPFIGGQLVDRYMPSQVFLGIAHLIGAAAAWAMAYQTDISGITLWMAIWSLVFAPTLGITNSIAFRHLNQPGTTAVERDRDFSIVRTAGTFGWIVAGLILTAYLHWRRPVPGQIAPFEEMQLTAVFGVILGLFSFALPHTPPAKEGTDPWAFTKAFKLFRLVPGFATFMLISFVAATEFQFFYVLSGPFLETPQIGVPHEWLATVKGSSQWAELVGLGLLLPLALPRLGMRKTLVLGVLAWPLRYFIFSLGEPLWLVIFSLTFHGIGFAFVFVTTQIYVDRVAPKDIRASAQSLLTLVTLGFGNLVGTKFCGWMMDFYTRRMPDPTVPGKEIAETNWAMVFLWPGLLTLFCAIAYWFTFKEPAPEPEDMMTETTPSTVPPIVAEET
jgi:nucleoside transporter